MRDIATPVRCGHCDILLEGRGQFVGHMIHGHDESVEQAKSAWNLACANRENEQYAAA